MGFGFCSVLPLNKNKGRVASKLLLPGCLLASRCGHETMQTQNKQQALSSKLCVINRDPSWHALLSTDSDKDITCRPGLADRLYIVLFRKDKFSRETVATFKRTVEAVH